MHSKFHGWVRLLGLAGLAFASAVFGQAARTYPDKPVRVIVGYSPGGLPDTIARLIGQKLSERWSQQFVVENKPGANGILGAEFVAKAAPDGYTLLMTDNSTHAILPFLFTKLPYDADRDLIPVSLTARAPLFLAVHPSVKANSFQELIALVKASPGKYSYGSSGIGSTHHLCMAYLGASLNLDMVHVPYKGTGQSVPALVGGQVPMVLSGYPTLAAHAKEGRVKLLAINSLKRSELAPDVPAIAETISGFDFAPTFGLFTPAGTPRGIIVKIGADVAQAVKLPDVVERMKNLGIDPIGASGDEWAKLLKSDAERYSKAVKISGAKVE
ncbi:MAG: tripartite tricarboxylate transporter substrate binding protein [Betaproteobacteria bacterium]|nr:MAG: tripartite tricarboxylate transporter substrate binding protein [Betaproteobacteria bacterium]